MLAAAEGIVHAHFLQIDTISIEIYNTLLESDGSNAVVGQPLVFDTKKTTRTETPSIISPPFRADNRETGSEGRKEAICLEFRQIYRPNAC